MKKILLFLCLFILPVIVNAKGYELDDINVRLEIGDDYYVFTRNNLEGNKELESLNVTKEYLGNLFLDNHIYMDILKKDLSSEMFLAMKDVKEINNLSNYEGKFIDKLGKELAKNVKASGFKVYNNQYKYILLEYPDKGYNIINYYTVINQKGYTFIFQKQGDISSSEKEEFKKVVDSATFKILDEFKKEPKKKTSSFNYVKVLISSLAGAVIGGISGLIIYLNNKKGNKKQSKGVNKK